MGYGGQRNNADLGCGIMVVTAAFGFFWMAVAIGLYVVTH